MRTPPRTMIGLMDVTQIHPDVSMVLRDVGKRVLLGGLGDAPSSARYKAPCEIVTDVDIRAEREIGIALDKITPGIPIVGEERATNEPKLLTDLESHEWAWLVDPLDGTKHYAQGRGPFGTMLALLHRGIAHASWIHLPLEDTTAFAATGNGVTINGDAVTLKSKARAEPQRGGLHTHFMPEPMKSNAATPNDLERTDGMHSCAAKRYIDILRGNEHFAAYWRTLPWDHAPGAFMIQEAGGIAQRFDGSPFVASDIKASGLIVAQNETTWNAVHRALTRRSDDLSR